MSIPSKLFAHILLNWIKPRVEVLLRVRTSAVSARAGGAQTNSFPQRVSPPYICMSVFFTYIRRMIPSIEACFGQSSNTATIYTPPKLLNIITALYENTSTAVRFYGKISVSLLVSNGVVCSYQLCSTFL